MDRICQIMSTLGISELNKMQAEAYKGIADGNGDVVVVSPTGSGKTLAYLLPLVGLIDGHSDVLQVVVIVPNRELAMQSVSVLNSMKLPLRAMCCYGGRPAMDEHRMIKQIRPQVVFGTPGRLIDHFDKGNLSFYTVRYAVIDEFDKCLEMGFLKEMATLFRRLSGVRRRFLLSATNAEQIPDFVNINNVTRVNYSNESIASRLNVFCLRSEEKDKLVALGDLLCVLGTQSSIVFLNYRDSVERVTAYLKSRGFVVSMFHGGLEQKTREAALYRFSNGSSNIFVSTDLASRGLDIPEVNNIIHYHLPLTNDSYVHRVGRTARWQSTGDVYFLLSPDEEVPDYVGENYSEYVMQEDLPEPSLPIMATIYVGKGKKDKISKGDILGFLCKVGGLGKDDIGKIDIRERYVYVAVKRDKVNQVLSRTDGGKIKGIKTRIEIVK